MTRSSNGFTLHRFCEHQRSHVLRLVLDHKRKRRLRAQILPHVSPPPVIPYEQWLFLQRFLWQDKSVQIFPPPPPYVQLATTILTPEMVLNYFYVRHAALVFLPPKSFFFLVFKIELRVNAVAAAVEAHASDIVAQLKSTGFFRVRLNIKDVCLISEIVWLSHRSMGFSALKLWMTCAAKQSLFTLEEIWSRHSPPGQCGLFRRWQIICGNDGRSLSLKSMAQTIC